MVPGFYAKKKKMSSGTSGGNNSGRNSGSSSGHTPEQSQGVTASINDSIEAKEIISLRLNEVDGFIREDMAFQNRVNERIIRELKTPKEIKIGVEVSNKELSLAQEFGVAKLLGLGRNATKNPIPCDNLSHSACDNLTGKSSLNKSHDNEGIRVHKSKTPRASRTWTRKERSKPRDNTAASFQTQGKK